MSVQRILDKNTLLSIVIPVYNEEAVLDVLKKRIIQVADRAPVSVEILLINDGSSDRTLEIISDYPTQDSRFRIIDLSRNFGHQFAVTAGLSQVAGDVVAILDADLQDPPEVILGMLERWQDGVDVVYGQRHIRRGESFFKRTTAMLFYRYLSKMVSIDIPKDTGDFRVVDRRVADIVSNLKEQHLFLRGLFAWVGFRQEAFLYDRDPRVAGETKYPLGRMISFSLNGLFSFSKKPLRWMIFLGFSMTVLSFMGGVYLLVVRLLNIETFPPGLAGMFITMMFLFGINFIFLGIIGEYVGRSYENVQGRPNFLIRDIISSDKSSLDRSSINTSNYPIQSSQHQSGSP